MPKLTAHVSRTDRVDRVAVDVPDEAFITLVANPGLTIDVSGASKAAGAPVILWNLHRGANQRWKIQIATDFGGNTGFRIVSAHSGLCLTLAEDDRTGPVTQTPIVDNDPFQVWMLNGAEGGYELRHTRLINRITAEEIAPGKALKGNRGEPKENMNWVFTTV
jgi:hypothetical protein